MQSIISKILSQYLAQYFTNFNPQAFKINLKGTSNVELFDLKLKSHCLEHLFGPDCPFLISHGYIGKLRLLIPFITNLRKSSVKIQVEDVYMVLRPKKGMEVDPDEEKKRLHEYKTMALAQFEAKHKLEHDLAAEKAKDKGKEEKVEKKKGEMGVFEKLAETIINNLLVNVHNVHARYEDNVNAKNPIVLGATLETVQVISTNSSWQKTFFKQIQDLTYKKVILSNFSLYINSQENVQKTFLSLYPELPHEKLVQIMKKSISTRHQHILRPVQGQLRLQMQKLSKSMDLKRPQFDAELEFSSLKLQLDDLQYRNVMSLIDYMSNFSKFSSYQQFKPQVLDARRRWQFALDCVRHDKKKKKATWSDLKLFLGNRTRYIELYKKFLELSWVPKMSQEEREEFEELEKSVSLQNLIFFRRLARAEVRLEKKKHSKWRKEQLKPKNLFSNKNTFFNKLITTLPKPGVIQISEEDRKELYASVGYADGEEDASVSKSENFVKMKLNFILPKVSLVLRDSKARMDVVKLSFRNLLGGFRFLNESFSFNATMSQFKIRDQQAHHALFKDILRKDSLDEESPLMSLCVIKNPPQADSSYYIGLSMDHVNIIVNMDVVQRLLSFFNFDHVNYQRLESMARKNLGKLTTVAQDELKKALESRMMLDLDIGIRAPHIIFPVDPKEEQSELLFVDLGEFTARTSRDPEGRKKRLEEGSVSEKDMYDQLKITMKEIRVVVPEARAAKIMRSEKKELPELPVLKKKPLPPVEAKDETEEETKTQEGSKPGKPLPTKVDENTEGKTSNPLPPLPTIKKHRRTSSGKPLPTVRPAHHRTHSVPLPPVPVLEGKPLPQIQASEPKKKQHQRTSSGNPLPPLPVLKKKPQVEKPQVDESSQDAPEQTQSRPLPPKPLPPLPKTTSLLNTDFPEKDHLVPKTSFELLVNQSLVPQNLAIPKFDIISHLKSVKASVSPSKVKVILRLMDRFIDFLENPTAGSESDLKVRGTLFVNGPITNGKWVKSRIEVRTTRKMFIYDDATNKQLGSIKLSSETKVSASHSKKQIFRLDLPQKSDTLTFFFATSTQESRNQWVDNLEQLIMDFENNFYIGKIASTLFSDLKKKVDDGMGILLPEADQVLLRGTFSLEKFSLALENGTPIAELKLENMKANLVHQRLKTTVDLSMSAMEALNVIPSKIPKDSRYALRNKNQDSDLVTINILRAAKNSPEYNPDAAIFVKAKCNDLDVNVETSLLVHLLRFGYDIQDVVDHIDLRKNVYQEFKKRIIKSKNFKYALSLQLETGAILAHVLYHERQLSRLRLSNAVFGVRVNTKILEIDGDLGNVTAMDLINPETVYKEILGLAKEKDKSMIQFQYKHNWRRSHDIEYGKFFSVKMQSIRYVHNQEFLRQIRNWLFRNLREALLREQKRVKTEEMDMHQWRLRHLVELNVELVDPTLLFPVHSTSKNLFIAHLGNIQVVNSLKKTVTEDIIENYEFKATSALLTSQLEGLENRKIVEDLDLNVRGSKLIVQSSPESKIPKLSANVSLSDIQVSLTQLEFQMGFNFLNQNIRPGLDSAAREQLFYKTIGTLSSQIALQTKPSIEIAHEVAFDQPESPFMKQGHNVDIDIQLFIPSVELTLLKDHSLPIGTLTMNKLFARNSYHENGTLRLEMNLRTMIAVDRRNKANQFKTFFDSQSKGKENEAVEFLFERTPAKINQCVIKFSDPKAVFVADVVLELKDFFMQTDYFASRPEEESAEGLSEQVPEMEESPLTDEIKHSKPIRHHERNASIESLSDLEDSTSISEDLKKHFNNISIKAKMGQFEILFPENTADLSSRTLMVTGGIDLEFFKNSTVETGSFNLTSLSAFVTQSQFKQDEERVHLLEPITITAGLTQHKTDSLPERHVAVHLVEGDRCRISYQDIKLIYGIATQLNIFKGTEELLTQSLGDEKQIGKLMQDHIADVPDHLRSTIRLQFTSAKPFNILVVDDINGFDLPLLNAKVQGVDCNFALYYQEKAEVEMAVKFRLSSDYYNFSIAEWEPVLELSKSPLSIGYRYINMPQTDKFVHLMNVTQDGTINLNVTHDMIDTVQRTAKLWIQGLQSQKNAISLKFHPYTIYNYSKLKVRMLLPGQEKDAIQLDENEYRFSLHSGKQIFLDSGESYVNLLINGCQKRINIKRTSHDLVNFDGISVYVSVELNEGRKVIEIHSGLEIFNSSSIDWNIGCYVKGSRVTVGMLSPGQSLYLPSTCVHPETSLCAQPAHSDYEWSRSLESTKWKRLPELNRILLSCSTEGGDRFYGVFKRRKQTNHLILDLEAPLVIENLLVERMKYEIFTKTKDGKKKKLKTREMQRGEREYLYKINMQYSLWMRVEVLSEGWKSSKQASLVYTPDNSPKTWSKSLVNLDEKGRELKILMDYSMREAYHVISVYVPYCVINHTKLNVLVRHGKEIAAGQTSKKSSGGTLDDIQESLLPPTPVADVPVETVLKEEDDGENSQKQPLKPESSTLPPTPQIDEPDFSAMQSSLLMFNYPNKTFFGQKINLLVDNKFASSEFSIDNPGTNGVVRASSGNSFFSLGISVDMGPGRFKRTTLVTLTPRYVLINRCDEPLFYRESGVSRISRSEPDSSKPLYSKTNAMYPRLTFKTRSTMWSKNVTIDSTREFPLILQPEQQETRDNLVISIPKNEDSEDEKQEKPPQEEVHEESDSQEADPEAIDGILEDQDATYLSVQVIQHKSIAFISVEKRNNPHYIIDNKSNFVISACQKGTTQWSIITEHTSLPFGWANSNGSHSLVIKCESHHTTVEFDVMSSQALLKIGEKTLHMRILTKQFTKILQIHDEESHSLAQRLNMEDEEDRKQNTRFQFFASFKSVGVSVIDSKPQELVYISAHKIRMRYNLTTLSQYLKFKVKRVQVDNQVKNCPFPVMLTNSKKLSPNQDSLTFEIVRRHRKNNPYDIFPKVVLESREFDLSMDSNLLNKISNFILTLYRRSIKGTSLEESEAGMHRQKSVEDMDGLREGLVDEELMSPHMNDIKSIKQFQQPILEPETDQIRTYFKMIKIFPTEFNLTFLFNEKDEEDLATKSSIEKVIEVIGTHFNLNLDESPIRLQGLVLPHPFATKRAILKRIYKHWRSQMVSQLYKSIGSFDFLGNPTKLFNDLDTGFYDLLYEPIDGMSKSPQEFAKGLARGSVSFVKHSTHGTFNSLSKLTESVGNGISYLSMDNDYMKHRQKEQRRKSRHVGEGVMNGLQSFGTGVVDGATGLITKPWNGATEEGVSGFMSGVGKGIVGVPVKPVTAVLDMFSTTLKGISNTATYFDKDSVDRNRLPRVFSPDGRVIPYNAHSAHGQDLLWKIIDGAFCDDVYLGHVMVGQDHALILSDKRYALLSYSQNFKNLEWHVPHEHLQDVKQTREGVVLLLNELGKQKQERRWFQSVKTQREVISRVASEINALHDLCAIRSS